MKRTIAILAFALTALAVSADEPITKPIRTTWIATSCATWNCAATALILANGDKYVLALPTGRDDDPWIVLRRVEEGAIFVPDEEPYTCSVFEDVHAAVIAFGSMDACRAPMFLTVPDGRAVIASLRACGGPRKVRADD